MARRPLVTLAAAASVSLGVLACGVALGLPTFTPDGATVTLVQLGSFFPLARGFEFVLGMATCLVWRRWVQPARLSEAIWTAAEGAALGASALWLLLLLPWLVFHAEGAVFVGLRAAGSSWLFAALLCVLAGGRGRVGWALSAPWLVKLGQASFAFYLVHVIVMRALAWHFGATGALAPLALSLGLAFLLHEGVEIPMRQRLLASPAPAPLRAHAL
jgi:peptidoglycan/LPS O-acetylase OafA/YrhL